jgi:hypothetical protein
VARRAAKRRHPRRGGARGVEPAVVSAERRRPIDVAGALRDVGRLRTDEDVALELVRMAFDVDAGTVLPFLAALRRIQDERWRARTIFSVFRRASRELIGAMPAPAQDEVVALVAAIGDETARALALRELATDVLPPLRDRLAALAEQLGDPLVRLRTVTEYEKAPSDDRRRALLDLASGIEDEEKRGEALVTLAATLSPPFLEEAYATAAALSDPGSAARAMTRLSQASTDAAARERAQLEILERSESIADPIREFDVLSQLRELPVGSRRATEARLSELAAKFEDPAVRCRAMFIAADYSEDEVRRKGLLLSGIAAAELVPERERAQLLEVLRGAGPWLDPAVRSEIRRVVDRFEDPALRDHLRGVFSRLYFAEPTPTNGRSAERAGSRRPRATAAREEWDVFISHAGADAASARVLASELRSRGLKVFLATDTLDREVGTSGWIEAVDGALQSSRALLVVATAASMASRWVAEEWRKYYHCMVESQRGKLVSLRLSGPAIGELPLTLRSFQVIDSATGRVEPEHISRILDLVPAARAV